MKNLNESNQRQRLGWTNGRRAVRRCQGTTRPPPIPVARAAPGAEPCIITRNLSLSELDVEQSPAAHPPMPLFLDELQELRHRDGAGAVVNMMIPPN